MTTEIIGFSTMAIALLGILGFTVSNSRSEGNKRSGMYKRMDEEREDAALTYVRKDIHELKYDQLSKIVQEVRTDVKKLLQKNGIE